MLLFDAVVVVMKFCLNTRQKRQPGHMSAFTFDSDTFEHHMASAPLRAMQYSDLIDRETVDINR